MWAQENVAVTRVIKGTCVWSVRMASMRKAAMKHTLYVKVI